MQLLSQQLDKQIPKIPEATKAIKRISPALKFKQPSFYNPD